jgi:hypothetical protein
MTVIALAPPLSPLSFFFAPGRAELGFVYFKCNVTEIKVCIKTRQITKRETKRESLNKGSKWEDTGEKKKEALKEKTERAGELYLYIKNIKNLYETRQAHARRVT